MSRIKVDGSVRRDSGYSERCAVVFVAIWYSASSDGGLKAAALPESVLRCGSPPEDGPMSAWLARWLAVGEVGLLNMVNGFYG